MTVDSAGDRLRRLIGDGVLHLPRPGSGRTDERWQALIDIGRDEDVSVARLAEAHVDAVAILHEAGLEPVPGAAYAVWASVGPGGSDVALGNATLTGTKPFCSGVPTVDRALVDVTVAEGRQLVEIDLTTSQGATWKPAGSWGTPALADTGTRGITFDGHPVARCVGDAGWYLRRPGFWHGACGPAACWAGAAAGLVAQRSPAHGPLAEARYGSLLTEMTLCEAVLAHAGRRIDGDPSDPLLARIVALSTRAAVHDSCLRLTDGFARLFGPRALVESETAQRHADVLLFVRQFHADDDLVALTGSILDRV